jgi:hypothetical protein
MHFPLHGNIKLCGSAAGCRGSPAGALMDCAGYFGRSELLQQVSNRRPISYSCVFIICNFKYMLQRLGLRRDFCMIHKGVEFTVSAVAPGIWKWQFRIGDKFIIGKTEARLNLLAIRRVQLRIDRELKKAEQK